MKVRTATIDDLDFIVAGNQRMAQETEDLTLDIAVLEPGVRAVLEGNRSATYRILEENGHPIAQLMLTYEWSDWRNRQVWWIQSVYVIPEHRGRGAFSALYRAVEAEARAEGAGGLRLYVDETNQKAQAVYTKLGMDGGHYRMFEAMF